jgi:hypothetical protein
MQIGRFFSLRQGQVGQYLSRRVLLIRTPFKTPCTELCYFGFDKLSQAQRFANSLALLGYTFKLRKSQCIVQPYEIQVIGDGDLAKTLAYWDRQDAT